MNYWKFIVAIVCLMTVTQADGSNNEDCASTGNTGNGISKQSSETKQLVSKASQRSQSAKSGMPEAGQGMGQSFASREVADPPGIYAPDQIFAWVSNGRTLTTDIGNGQASYRAVRAPADGTGSSVTSNKANTDISVSASSVVARPADTHSGPLQTFASEPRLILSVQEAPITKTTSAGLMVTSPTTAQPPSDPTSRSSDASALSNTIPTETLTANTQTIQNQLHNTAQLNTHPIASGPVRSQQAPPTTLVLSVTPTAVNSPIVLSPVDATQTLSQTLSVSPPESPPATASIADNDVPPTATPSRIQTKTDTESSIRNPSSVYYHPQAYRNSLSAALSELLIKRTLPRTTQTTTQGTTVHERGTKTASGTITDGSSVVAYGGDIVSVGGRRARQKDLDDAVVIQNRAYNLQQNFAQTFNNAFSCFGC